ARVCMLLAARFLVARRSRELTGIFALVVVVVCVPVGIFLASLQWGGEVPSQLVEAARVLALTPLGAAWAFPTLASAQDAAAVPVLLVAILTVLLLGAAWVALVIRAMTTAERPSSTRDRGGLGWFAVTPGTPGGAIAARSLLYWTRDRRYLANIIVIPVAAVLTAAPLLIAGVPIEIVALIPVPFLALFFGWLPHNDLAYDSTAIWMHIASGVRGISDRVGRILPVMLIAIPLLVITVPVATSLHGRWALLPAMVGVCASLFLAGLGLSSISSVVAPYAVSRPGEGAFQQPQRTGSTGVLAQGLVLFGAIAVSAPVLWWAWQTSRGEVGLAMPTMWLGLGTGVFVLAAGLTIGAIVFERRGGQLMEFAEAT
ncbi:MAG: hypothetical protein ACK5MP_01295, partial [Nostocoides sp.]